MFTAGAFAQSDEYITVTKTQFNNLKYITYEIQDRYPEFEGFHGSRLKLRFKGLDKVTLEKEIATIDIPTAIANHPDTIKAKGYSVLRGSIKEKLMQYGKFTEEETEFLLKNIGG